MCCWSVRYFFFVGKLVSHSLHTYALASLKAIPPGTQAWAGVHSRAGLIWGAISPQGRVSFRSQHFPAWQVLQAYKRLTGQTRTQKKYVGGQ